MNSDKILSLRNIVNHTKTKGLVRKLKTKHPDILKEINQFKKQKQISNTCEAIFLIINEMESKPICPSLSEKCISKLRFHSLEEGYSKYCSKCIFLSTKYKDKIKKTNLLKYGVENPMQRQDIINKQKEKSIEKYGVESTNQLPSVKRKKSETLKKHFGNKGLSHPSITEKKKLTNLKKYGTEWATQFHETQIKRKNTCIEKYGVDHVMNVPYIKNKVRKSLQSEQFMDYLNLLIESRGFDLISDYDCAHKTITIRCKKCNHEFKILWNSFQQGNGICPKCHPIQKSSQQEREISNFIKDSGIEVIENDRSIIFPLELDIVIPDKQIAIEFCGLWCHSSGGNVPYIKDKFYHNDKLNKCNAKSYRLITIFEDEWTFYKDVVLSRISYLIGDHTNMTKIRASKCEIKYLDFKTKSNFLKKYHLQGDKVSKINLGLFYNDTLVSVMTFSEKSKNVYELDRFCNLKNYIIYGAASKLLKNFKKEHDWKEIFSYADRRWSTGNVYYKLGFELDYITQPNYWYWGKEIKGRKHRLNYSKNRLKNMESFNENLTEFQIMSLEKYSWVYDCGNYKFKMLNS